ncbi:receptor-like serine/threonine-protein kinase SD1-8 isoform X2 [Magnolia sinica]|uniref:receptor-like serine/threonine-protein kinase SD1-8 isoform X2 n=1 Tax=Magnolia sinica TaxID=86752 RepID=UPI0026585DC6|nr:receptor-like serine/threonine-protein kinase SD1-8 isoform X2 [Magnolia sinica]
MRNEAFCIMAFLLRFSHPLLISFFLFPFCTPIDTIIPTQTIDDGETLVSAGEKFVLGFFSPGNSRNRYVGIWYNHIRERTVVWVANRENPLTNSSGVLTIVNGNIVLLDASRRTLWSAINGTDATNYSTARLLDSGNLLLSDNEGRILWESFDHPTDTVLPGMKVGVDRRTGIDRYVTSWKSPNDPAHGEFSFRLDSRGLPQFILWKGSERVWRSGPWNGQRLSGVPEMNLNFIFNFRYVANEHETYFTYDLYNASVISRMVLNGSGELQRLTWLDRSHRWNLFWATPGQRCDQYAQCGTYAGCNANQAPSCECLHGFEPRSPQDWYLRDGSDGCVRRRPLECEKGDGFFKLAHAKLPDTLHARVDTRASQKECEDECLKNCSCTAYSSADINGGGSGCMMWGGDLIDLEVYSDGGQDIYVRVAASELDSKRLLDKKKMMILIITIILGAILFASCGCYLWRRQKKREGSGENERNHGINEIELEESTKGSELPLFDLHVVAAATNNFSSENKLGEGGFGPVYKGKLMNGEEIAVKRLSKNSGQGSEEFRNEILLIAKLQHRNLVRIIGCCTQGEEKMLIYEYMRNKSLDWFIFDEMRRVLLDWTQRFKIIMGIARGVLYLHQDSRLRIIHRDLKASNVLLDDEMNPRISDFGMARIFGGNQTQANTNRVVGTFGYMSPEYAMDGLFSVKSDVFSFGVLLLEIINGKRNNSCFSDDPSQNLIRYAWGLWNEGRGLELVDSSMVSSCPTNEVRRCIQVGLLCVQENAKDRPTMASVVFMLGIDTAMPTPKQPAFCVRRRLNNEGSPTSGTGSYSINEVSITDLQAR